MMPGTAALPPLAVGQALSDGRLIVEAIIGSGSNGLVYRALDREFGRCVALKTLADRDPDRLYNLKREFRSLERLVHPNLVRLYSLGAVDDRWFVTMELVDGTDLGGWLGQRQPRHRILQVFGDLARGLRALHAAGLMHRDVKPANVMVTREDRVVLLDFGLATPIRGTAPTLAAGTLDYMAPEQLWNEHPGAAADWYSFGVMLFEALAGTRPFERATRLKSMRRPPAVGLRDLAPEVPPALDEMVRRLLDPDPARRPTGEEVTSRLEQSPSSRTPSPTTPPAGPFVGRTDALGQLRQAFDQLKRGTTRVIHVHGPSGIGKTTLVRHFLSEVRRGAPVLTLEGACHPHESVPYKALDALIDNLARYLVGLDSRAVLALAPRHAAELIHLFPVLARAHGVREWPASSGPFLDPAELRRRGFDAVRELFGKLGDRHQVVLWIDDIQWSDRDSGALLRVLLTSPDAPRLLVIVTSRESSPESRLLAQLGPEVTPADLPLGPMSSGEIAALARHLMGAQASHVPAAAIVSEADGSPFLAGELVRYLRDSDAGETKPGGLRVAEVVRARVRRLPSQAQRLLAAVAVAGRPIDPELALQVAGLEAADRALAYAMCADCLLRMTNADQPCLECYHDRVRELVVDDLAAGEREAIHRELALAIRGSRNPDARLLVHHYRGAGDAAAAAHFALMAAQQAEHELAFDQAVEMYDIVLAARPGAAADPGLLERRADVLAHAARRTEAALAYEAAAGLAMDAERRTSLHVRAAEQFFCGGELARGLAALEGVLEQVGLRVPVSPLLRAGLAQWRRLMFILRGVERRAASEPGESRVRLDALWRATRGIVMLDPALADVLAGIHLLDAMRSGDRSRVVRAVGLEAAFEANIGGAWLRQRSRRLLATAERDLEGDPYDAAWLAHCRAACAWFDGRWLECVTLGEHAGARLTTVGPGAAWDLTVLHGFMLSALANLGRLRELSDRMRVLIGDAERRHDRYALRVFRTGDAVWALLAADEPAQALLLAEESVRDYPVHQFTSQHRHHLVAAVHAHLYCGDAARAWQCVSRAWPALRWSGFLLLDCLGTQLRYVRACAALALAADRSCPSRGRLLRLARREARRVARSALPMARPMADTVDAAVAGAEGRPEVQTAALRKAADGFDRADMALHAAAVRWHLASLGESSGKQPASADWWRQQGVLHPEAIARAIVPRPGSAR